MHVLANRHNPEAHEKISANDFTMDLEDVAEMTDADVIARANAQAWDEEDEFVPCLPSNMTLNLSPAPASHLRHVQRHLDHDQNQRRRAEIRRGQQA